MRRATIGPALVVFGGSEWAIAFTAAYFRGEGAFLGSLGLVLIASGLWAIGRRCRARAQMPPSEGWISGVGAVLVIAGLAAFIWPWPEIGGIVVLLIIPTAFVLGPCLVAVWAVRTSSRSQSDLPKVLAIEMLIASLLSIVTSGLLPPLSLAATVAFGLLAAAFGVAQLRIAQGSD